MTFYSIEDFKTTLIKSKFKNMSEKDNINVTILGSGTCVPSLIRSSCSVFVKIGQSKILIDSGAGTMHRLLETGTTIFDITHIFYSHFHPDHSSELVQFIFSNKYSGSVERKIPLTITAGDGFKNFYNGLKAVFGQWIEFAPGMMNIFELNITGPDSIGFNDFKIKSIPMKHTSESLAFRITGPNGKSMVYSGDTDINDNLVELSTGTDLLICESAFPDDLKTQGHMTPSLAGTVALKAGVGKLVLTHLYPECDGVDIAKECRKIYSGPLAIAEDLMEIVI